VSVAVNGAECPPQKVPRRVIHCSDGVVEEYSTDDDDDDDQVDATSSRPSIDPVRVLAFSATYCYYFCHCY